MAKKGKSNGKDRARARREVRFEPIPTTSPLVAYALGAVGAALMGAGAWAVLSPMVVESAPEPLKGAWYTLVGGSLAAAAAIWLGTSGEPALRVGDAGIGVDKGQVRRMPWHAVERIEWRGEAVRVTGKDTAGLELAVVVRVQTHPQAAAWIVKEARERIPAVVDVPADATLPVAQTNAGRSTALDPIQVVGMRCAASDKIISYEPDAYVCRRCERVYLRGELPAACKCGAALGEAAAEPRAG